MLRPNRALCGIVLGLAVLVGCSKKPKIDSSPSGATEPTPSQYPSTKAPTAPGPSNKTPPAPAPVAGGPKLTGEPKLGGESPAPGIGQVALIQGRFDKVEGALAAARGKVVLVDCWARWCPPCITSFPKLVEKHEKYGPKGLVCVSVSLDGGQKRFTTDQVHAFLKERNATFQNFYLTDLQSDNGAMDARFGEISGIPHAVLFNRKGEKTWHGHPMDKGLVAMIETELAK